MTASLSTNSEPDVKAGRLDASEYAARFGDATPPMSHAEAIMEAERCLYCYDAPCQTACPTGIDVPSFIKRIADGNLRGSAKTILEANPLGGMCARVCPTEDLCEKVCVRNTQAGVPVAIGRLQRFAVDALMHSDKPQVFTRAAATGKRVAVVGAGPAGLACAHTLARLGHKLVVFDANSKAGGLNEYGLASYKTPNNFAQKEIDWLLGIGDIEIRQGWKLETTAQLDALRNDYDALFLGMGLSDTHQLGLNGENLGGVQDAVHFIAALRQSSDLSTLPVGRRVIVIGGGMTAVDASVQSKLLGAETVTMVYRRGPADMSSSKEEQEWAQTNGVTMRHWMAPAEILSGDSSGHGNSHGHVNGVKFAKQVMKNGKLTATGEFETLPADMVLKAIGQTLGNPVLNASGLMLEDGRMVTDTHGQTNIPGVWAGGDCRAGGLDLTVEAVEHGKRSAKAMHAYMALAQPK